MGNGIQSSLQAAAQFKDLGMISGEALAKIALATGYSLQGKQLDAETAAQEAANMFRSNQDSIGEALAKTLVSSCKMPGAATLIAARASFDNAACAHVELSPAVSNESLQAVIAALLANTLNFGSIVLHLDGGSGAASQNWAVASETFIMGLRCVEKPVVLACWGKIAGPSWGFVLCCDYRICANQSSFILPIWGKPETLVELAGCNNATQFNLQNGPTHALNMLEAGIVHECRKGTGDTQKAASEL